MKNRSTGRLGGFTLIELLVVVLIIGILSAVALPQYQKAVEKSRAAEALTNLRAIVNAVQLSKMANGVPAEKLEDLDVSLPGEKIDERIVKLKNFTYDIRNFGKGTEGFEAVARRNDATTDDRKYYIYFSYSGHWACTARTEAAKGPCSAVCARSDFYQRSSTDDFFAVSNNKYPRPAVFGRGFLTTYLIMLLTSLYGLGLAAVILTPCANSSAPASKRFLSEA